MIAVSENVAISGSGCTAAIGGAKFDALVLPGKRPLAGDCGVIGDHGGALSEVLEPGVVKGDHTGGVGEDVPWSGGVNSSVTSLAFRFG